MDVSTRIIRCVRRIGIDRNPLRRPTDRVGAWFTAALTAVVLTGTPIVAWRCGEAAYRGAAAAEQERQRLVAVPAVLLEDTPAVQVFAEDAQTQFSVTARWTAPDGTVRSGSVSPPTPAVAGTTIMIWTDVSGNVRDRAPVTGPSTSAAGAIVTCLLVILAGYAGILVGLRWYRNRRSMVSWQREWMCVEPRWSGRR
jgi:hypothetical protein